MRTDNTVSHHYPRKTSEEQIWTLFLQFKRKFTFRTPQEAAEGMEDFLCSLRRTERMPRAWKRMYELCCVVKRKAQDYDCFIPLDDDETLEWLVTPMGAALVRRCYYGIPYMDLSEQLSCREGTFVADYDASFFVIAEDAPIIGWNTLLTRTALPSNELLQRISRLPAYSYEGSMANPEEISVTLGTALVLADDITWPTPAVWPTAAPSPV